MEYWAINYSTSVSCSLQILCIIHMDFQYAGALTDIHLYVSFLKKNILFTIFTLSKHNHVHVDAHNKLQHSPHLCDAML